MPHYPPTCFGYERNRHYIGSAQCGKNELLGMTADRQGSERSDRELGDGADIGARFVSVFLPCPSRIRVPLSIGQVDTFFPTTFVPARSNGLLDQLFERAWVAMSRIQNPPA